MKKFFMLLAFLYASIPYIALAETSESKAINIMTIALEKYYSFGISEATGTLITKKRGKDVSGKIGIYQITVARYDDNSTYKGNVSLLAITSPASLSKTQLLTKTRRNEDYSQYYFDRDLHKAKRVSSHGSSIIVSSEFSYSILGRVEIAYFTNYEYLGTRKCGELTCHAISRTPNFSGANYTLQEVWVADMSNSDKYRRINRMILKKADRPYKTMLFDEYTLINNEFWRPSKVSIKNHKRRRTSTIVWTKWEFKPYNNNVYRRLSSRSMPVHTPVNWQQ